MVNIDITEPGQDEPLPEIDQGRPAPAVSDPVKPDLLTRRELAILIL